MFEEDEDIYKLIEKATESSSGRTSFKSVKNKKDIFDEEDQVEDLKDSLKKVNLRNSKKLKLQDENANIDDFDLGEKIERKNEEEERKHKEDEVEEPIILDAFEEETDRIVDATEEGNEAIKLRHQVRHQVAIPTGYPYIPISQHVPDKNPARTYPFTLDPFQRVSIHSIQRNESVLVAAHTSAGKTVVAEYAIAQALKNNQRVIYTSPIKALSNQKYREFAEEFGDVGLMTGDVTIAPNASCLVMTTEILRSMLYRGSEVVREVAWVIYDEIHYMRDKSRGVIWEETLILLPSKVRFVFLSATIPNALEFANWIVRLHQQPCHVVYTDFRPTPLQHYLFPEGGDGIRIVVDEKGTFREENFNKALSFVKQDSLAEEVGGSGKGLKKKIGKKVQGTDSDIYKVVKLIMTKNYHPVIVFSFGKRECEILAQQMSKIDFNSNHEAELVNTIFTNAISSLSEEDQSLPQIVNILPLLKRGIGIHHSGLLQILKEVIEILFQEGLLKVLFATETFSIGLNMPAKTVVFTSVRKFDGTEDRWISSGEYIQMSGRAGRRGLDERGIVIMMIDSKMEPNVAKSMIQGQSDVLTSAFNLNYNMILNLLRVEGVTPEFILERSFMHFQNLTALPKLQKAMESLNEMVVNLRNNIDNEVINYYQLNSELNYQYKKLKNLINQPEIAKPFLHTGRLVKIKYDNLDFGYGFVVNLNSIKPITFVNNKNEQDKMKLNKETKHIVDVLLLVDSNSTVNELPKDVKLIPEFPTTVLPPKKKNDSNDLIGVWKVIPVSINLIDGYSQVVVNLPKDLTNESSIDRVSMIFKELKKRFPNDSYPLLHPIKNMKLKGEEAEKLVDRVEKAQQLLAKHPLAKHPQLDDKLTEYDHYLTQEKLLQKTKAKIHSAQAVAKLDELKCCKRVLRRLGFLTSNDVVELKGRVACELTSGHELLLTELMFHGLFNNLTVEQCTALLSIFVFDEKTDSEPKLQDEMDQAYKMVKEHARYICKVSNECRLPLDEELYLNQLKPHLIEVVLAWCAGVSFLKLTQMTPVFEGSIIRLFRRLEELLQQMSHAAKAIGNRELELKFADGVRLIKRDIVFAASLYL